MSFVRFVELASRRHWTGDGGEIGERVEGKEGESDVGGNRWWTPKRGRKDERVFGDDGYGRDGVGWGDTLEGPEGGYGTVWVPRRTGHHVGSVERVTSQSREGCDTSPSRPE